MKRGNSKGNAERIVFLLIVAIVLAISSMILTISFDRIDSVSTGANVEEYDSASASVGLVVQGTGVNQNE